MNVFESNLSHICEELSEEPGVRFVGVINKFGKVIATSFKEKVVPYISDQVNRDLYMKHCLEITMKKDFDEFLGPLEYISTRRKKILMVTIPVETYTLIISAKPTVDPEKIAKLAINFFKDSIRNLPST